MISHLHIVLGALRNPLGYGEKISLVLGTLTILYWDTSVMITKLISLIKITELMSI
jgi:hypothetical protein